MGNCIIYNKILDGLKYCYSLENVELFVFFIAQIILPTVIYLRHQFYLYQEISSLAIYMKNIIIIFKHNKAKYKAPFFQENILLLSKRIDFFSILSKTHLYIYSCLG